MATNAEQATTKRTTASTARTSHRAKAIISIQHLARTTALPGPSWKRAARCRTALNVAQPVGTALYEVYL